MIESPAQKEATGGAGLAWLAAFAVNFALTALGSELAPWLRTFGIGGDEEEWRRGGQPNVILDNLIADRKTEPMIVVMPNGRAQPDDRPGPNAMATAPARPQPMQL